MKKNVLYTVFQWTTIVSIVLACMFYEPVIRAKYFLEELPSDPTLMNDIFYYLMYWPCGGLLFTGLLLIPASLILMIVCIIKKQQKWWMALICLVNAAVFYTVLFSSTWMDWLIE